MGFGWDKTPLKAEAKTVARQLSINTPLVKLICEAAKQLMDASRQNKTHGRDLLLEWFGEGSYIEPTKKMGSGLPRKKLKRKCLVHRGGEPKPADLGTVAYPLQRL
jgi:hypothetical protein